MFLVSACARALCACVVSLHAFVIGGMEKSEGLQLAVAEPLESRAILCSGNGLHLSHCELLSRASVHDERSQDGTKNNDAEFSKELAGRAPRKSQEGHQRNRQNC